MCWNVKPESIAMTVTQYLDLSQCTDLELELAVSGERFDAVEVIASATVAVSEVEAVYAGPSVEADDWSDLAA